MRKDDVAVRDGCPAANVKVRKSIWSVPLPLDLGRVSEDGGQTWQDVTTDAGFTTEWVEEHLTTNEIACHYDMALDEGWEQLQAEAEDIFGATVEVYSDGRSGGWAVVRGLDAVESWDAIALGRWARFEKTAAAIAADVPRATLATIYANAYEAMVPA